MAGGLAAVAVGVVAGLLGTLALGSTVRRFLYGVEATDITSLALAAAVLLGAAVLATIVPAARAGHTDPVTALRAE